MKDSKCILKMNEEAEFDPLFMSEEQGVLVMWEDPSYLDRRSRVGCQDGACKAGNKPSSGLQTPTFYAPHKLHSPTKEQSLQN